MNDDTLSLDGNIQLTGFRDVEPAMMIVIKKLIGNNARHFSTKCSKFELLRINMKKIHEKEHTEKYEVHAMVVDNGKQYTATVTERNLFVALDSSMKKVENEISK